MFFNKEDFVLEAGLEPARPRWPQDFKSGVSTNSTTRAFTQKNCILKLSKTTWT